MASQEKNAVAPEESQQPREAVIYCRTAREEQAGSRQGVEDQEGRCRKWAEANGLVVADVFLDIGVSGLTGNRPGLRKALEAIGPGRVLVCKSVSRLTRSMKDLPVLVKGIEGRGGALVCLDEQLDTRDATGAELLQMAYTRPGVTRHAPSHQAARAD